MVVGDIIRITANRCPTNIGVVFEDVRLTWRELNERVNAFANALISLGLKKGERIAIMSENCNQYLEVYLAAAKIGAVNVPLNNWLKHRELEHQLGLAEPSAIVVDDANVARLNGLDLSKARFLIGLGRNHGRSLDYETMVASGSRLEPLVEVDPEDPFCFAFTSGTTGRAKAAVISHRNSVVGSTLHALAMQLRPHHASLAHAPMFVFGSCANRFNCIMTGAKLVFSKTDAQSLLAAIERERITHFTIGATALQRMVSHPEFARYDTSSVQFIAGSGAPTPAPLVREVVEKLGKVWHVWFGLTETIGGTFLLSEDWISEGIDSRRMASIGRGSPLLEVDVVNEEGRSVPRDGTTVGELIFRGESVSKGYYNDPEATAATIKNGWFHSGDLGSIDADGFIFLVDRKKDMIVSGGMNIYPKEIEDLLHSHPAVELCAVVGIPDKRWGETPKAFVRLRAGTAATELELIEFCKENLASYKKPAAIEFVTAFPLSGLGKIIKRELVSPTTKLQ